jgi:GNAT superfamily N-acetyltransferase
VDSFSLRIARSDELQLLIDIDDEASELFLRAGITLALEKDPPFVVDESVRWAAAISKGLAHVAVDVRDRPIGFITLRYVDGEPYLDQIAVRLASMRRGAGTALLRQAVLWSANRPFWLTTYSHLPWNKPYYERHGFEVVPESMCGSELHSILEQQRAVLPHPEQRVAMVRRV